MTGRSRDVSPLEAGGGGAGNVHDLEAGGGGGGGSEPARRVIEVRAAIAGARLCKKLQQSQTSESLVEPLIRRMGQNCDSREQTKRFSEIPNKPEGRSRDVCTQGFSEIAGEGRSRDLIIASALAFLGISHIGAREITISCFRCSGLRIPISCFA